MALTFCKYDLRKYDLFVRREPISSDLVMCGGGVRSILLLPRVAIYRETIDVCIWCKFVLLCCSDCVEVCGNVCCVAAVVEDSGSLAMEC